jgi:hypothetical protein
MLTPGCLAVLLLSISQNDITGVDNYFKKSALQSLGFSPGILPGAFSNSSSGNSFTLSWHGSCIRHCLLCPLPHH